MGQNFPCMGHSAVICCKVTVSYVQCALRLLSWVQSIVCNLKQVSEMASFLIYSRLGDKPTIFCAALHTCIFVAARLLCSGTGDNRCHESVYAQLGVIDLYEGSIACDVRLARHSSLMFKVGVAWIRVRSLSGWFFARSVL